MNRAVIAVVALVGFAGLTGCSFPTGLFGSAGRTVPPGPSMTGCPSMRGPCGPHARPTGPRGAFVMSGGGTLTDNVNDSYVELGPFTVSGTESTVEIPVPVGGTLSDLHVFVSTAPGTDASWTLTVDKNGSATALTCAIAGDATSCSDASLVTVVAADKLDLDVAPFGRPALGAITWSVSITP